MRLIRLIKRIVVVGLIGSLATGIDRDNLMIKAAERFEVHFEDMSIPISIKELNDWTKNQDKQNTELASWLSLLGFKNREGLAKFLQEPFVKDKDMALHLLRSWYGRKMFEEVVELIRFDNESSEKEIFKNLEEFLETSTEVTFLDLIKNLPAEVIHIDLDGMVKVANKWREELKRQQKLLLDLEKISIPEKNVLDEKFFSEGLKEIIFEEINLEVPHRSTELAIEIWEPSEAISSRKSWIILMPGLGGDSDHFRWLARSLSHHGWSVVVLQHPGSDSDSVKALLDGREPAPGLEVIPDRLADLRAVLNSRQKGIIEIRGEKLILMGHSLGALTAFLASGAEPQLNLKQSCSKALDDFSLTNLSALLQCQLADFTLPVQEEIPDLEAIVGINSFGSLLWQSNSGRKISYPVLLTGGTFDLVTPAINEQLGLLLTTKPNPLSRVLLIEGASHFSPIRVRGQKNQIIGEDVFKLSQSLVGVHPLSVQSLLAKEIIRFLIKFENEEGVIPAMNLVENDIRFHILDRTLVKELIKSQ